VALARTTLLHRLYVRALKGPAYAAATEAVGPAKVSNVSALAVTGQGAVYWASEAAVGVVTPANAPPAGPGGRLRGLAVDITGNLVVLEQSALRPIGAQPMPLNVTRGTGAIEPLKSPDAAVQLSSGDWLVMDDNERGIQKFSKTGAYVGPFVAAKVTRLAVNASDEIAGLDRDQKAVILYDANGKTTGRIPLKGTGYDLQNPEDLTYDVFGHLYVLDRGSIAVFSPYVAQAGAAAPAAAGAAATSAPAGRSYRLLTLFSEPQSPTAFRRASAFALDPSGAVYLYDDRAERVLVYR